MNQASYRSALGGVPVRPNKRVRLRGRSGMGAGVDSRVQPTARLLSAYGRAAGATASRVPGLGAGVDSRVQPTAYLLAHAGRPASSVATPIVRAGVAGGLNAVLSRGLGAAPWLLQGVALAMGSEFIGKMLESKETKEEKLNQAGARPKPSLGTVAPVAVPILPGAPVIGAGGQVIGAAAGKSIGGKILGAAGGPVGLAIMGVTTAITQFLGFKKRRGARKVATTQIVDGVAPIMVDNVTVWNNSTKTVSEQQQALKNFDDLWDYVKQACGDPQMGTPGQWCINDRKRGGPIDWFKMFRDPIANDPHVRPDPPIGFATVVDERTGEVIEVATPEQQLKDAVFPLMLAGAALFLFTR